MTMPRRVLHIFLDDNLDAANRGLTFFYPGAANRGLTSFYLDAANRGLTALCLAGADEPRAFAPVVACLENSPLAKELEEAGVTVLPLSGVSTWRPGVWGRLNKARRIHNFAMVHTHDLLAARLGAKCRLAWPQIRWAHTCWTPPAPNRPKDLEKLRPADMLATLNQEGARRLEAAGFEAARLQVIPAGIDPAHCGQRPVSAQASNQADDQGRLKIAALGPLTADSGHAILLEALAQFNAAHPNLAWELRLAGGGPLFEDILRQAGAAGIGERMAFLGPQRPCDVLPPCDMLIAADLRGENGCEAIKQAWAAGLPVLCSDLPVHAEMVRHGENGLLAPHEDAAALAGQLSELWNDAALRDKLARGGRESLADYTLERMAGAYARLYEGLVATPGTEQNNAED